MPFSGQLPSARRVAAAVAATIAISCLANCAAFPSAVRDGTLGKPLVSSRVDAKSRAISTRGAILAASAGTYIDQLLADRDSTIERWSSRVTRPLRVWIDSSEIVAGAQAVYPATVRAAFQEWAATGIPIKVSYVDSPGVADIRVRWIDRLNKKTGSTTWRTDHAGWMLSGDITLATHISDGQTLDSRGMRAIALHETGHALGLSHSLDPADVMAALVHVDSLSATDRNTIKLVYSLQAGPVQ